MSLSRRARRRWRRGWRGGTLDRARWRASDARGSRAARPSGARGGSIQIEQPVKPRWPTPSSRPARRPPTSRVGDGRSQPRHQVEPGTRRRRPELAHARRGNRRGDRGRAHAVPGGDERVHDARDVARRREEPGVAGDAAHGARVLVVDDAAQLALRRCAGARVARAEGRCRCRAAARCAARRRRRAAAPSACSTVAPRRMKPRSL